MSATWFFLMWLQHKGADFIFVWTIQSLKPKNGCIWYLIDFLWYEKFLFSFCVAMCLPVVGQKWNLSICKIFHFLSMCYPRWRARPKWKHIIGEFLYIWNLTRRSVFAINTTTSFHRSLMLHEWRSQIKYWFDFDFLLVLGQKWTASERL